MAQVRIFQHTSPKEVIPVFESIGVTSQGINIMYEKSVTLPLRLYRIKTYMANILKQEMLSLGGDCALERNVISGKTRISDVVLLGTICQIRKLTSKLAAQNEELKILSGEIEKILDAYLKPNNMIDYGRGVLDVSKPLVMGIINVTPDSFFDGGKYSGIDGVLKQAESMIYDGADILDIGGESTRPGAEKVSEENEKKRVAPVIEAIRNRFEIPVSVDTYKSSVASTAIGAGADIINDISGLNFDANMAAVAAKHNAPVILMHIKGTPENMQVNPQYEDLIWEIICYFENSINIALDACIKREKIILDPGIGFGKSVEDNFTILKNLKEFRIFGMPILIGASRKSFIGKALGQDNPSDRLAGTLGTHSAALMNGASIIRAHDVRETKDIIEIIDRTKRSMQ